jgi:ribonuclease-3
MRKAGRTMIPPPKTPPPPGHAAKATAPEPSQSAEDLARFQAALGIRFRDSALFAQALTHRSFLNEHPEPALLDNERLEFLGDAVLGFIAAEYLLKQLPDLREGELTRLRSGVVRNERLADYAGALGIGAMLFMGRGEEENEGRAKKRNLSGAFEAILGALYLDQGIAAARAFAQPWLTLQLDLIMKADMAKDAKSRLQEWSQTTLGVVPTYRVVNVTGPEHAPEFTVQVLMRDALYGTGKGRNKQAAAQAAAQNALEEKGIQG